MKGSPVAIMNEGLSEEVSELLKIFDNYVILIENPQVLDQLTVGNLPSALSCCRSIERVMVRAEDEGKTTELMSNLVGHWSTRGRTHVYSIESLQRACDKFVEVLMRAPGVDITIIDRLLSLYVNNCGVGRLNKLLESLLSESLANVALECMLDLGLDKSAVEDEGRVFLWHSQASRGHREEVMKCIEKMIDDGLVDDVIESLAKVGPESPARKLILQVLSGRINDYDEDVCAGVLRVSRSLLEILVEDEDFRLNYIDAIFYFGRSMRFEGGLWKGSHRFSFGDIVEGLKGLMRVDEGICEGVKTRMATVKGLEGGEIWREVEEACWGELEKIAEGNEN